MALALTCTFSFGAAGAAVRWRGFLPLLPRFSPLERHLQGAFEGVFLGQDGDAGDVHVHPVGDLVGGIGLLVRHAERVPPRFRRLEPVLDVVPVGEARVLDELADLGDAPAPVGAREEAVRVPEEVDLERRGHEAHGLEVLPLGGVDGAAVAPAEEGHEARVVGVGGLYAGEEVGPRVAGVGERRPEGHLAVEGDAEVADGGERAQLAVLAGVEVVVVRPALAVALAEAPGRVVPQRPAGGQVGVAPGDEGAPDPRLAVLAHGGLVGVAVLPVGGGSRVGRRRAGEPGGGPAEEAGHDGGAPLRLARALPRGLPPELVREGAPALVVPVPGAPGVVVGPLLPADEGDELGEGEVGVVEAEVCASVVGQVAVEPRGREEVAVPYHGDVPGS